MAEATSALECSINEQKGVVLRVKRKRTDDPVEALVVSHVIPSKKAHISSDENVDKNQDDKNVSSEIFRLFGTCNEGDDTRSNDLLKNFSKTKAISHVDPKKASKERRDQTKRKQKQRQANKESQSDARFRIISSLRQEENSSDSNSVEQGSSGLQRTVSSDGSTDSADDEVRRLFTVYDVIRDKADDNSNKKKALREKDDTNTILCNSVKMIREKLVVSEEKSPLDLLDKNYVYDYYYASSSDKQLGDILEITGLDDDDLFLETRDREFEEMFEDDDDSNDENNWRNDYPDEDECSSDNESKPRRMAFHEDFGFDIDDDLKYDRRAFGEDLSSDDELNDYGQPYSLSCRREDYSDELNDDADLEGLSTGL